LNGGKAGLLAAFMVGALLAVLAAWAKLGGPGINFGR
jgi:hypothetical protein